MKIKETWSNPIEGTNILNPFSRGSLWLNCFAALCGPLPPSFLNLRRLVEEPNEHPPETIRYYPDDNVLHSNRVWDSSLNQPRQEQKRYMPRDYV